MIRVAMLWLVNEKDELLVARRADHKATDPGLWGPSVTGRLEPGETFEEALLRETVEELGLDLKPYPYRFLFETDFVHPDGRPRRFKVFAATFHSALTATLRPDPDEVAEIAWRSVAELRELVHANATEYIVPSAFALWEQIFDELDRQFRR